MNRSKSARHKFKEPGRQEINTLVTLFSHGRYPEAENLARTLTVRFPLHGFGWTVLGAVLKQTGQNVEALAAMQQAAALTPGAATAHNNLGLVFNDLCRQEEALSSFRRALGIEPEYAEAHSNLGTTLHELGRLDEAKASFERALQIQPNDAAAHNNLGLTLHELGQLDEAVASYRRALQIQPEFAVACYNLGNSLKMADRLDEAESSYRRALQIQPDYAKAHSNLGALLQESGRLSEAEASIRRALQITPDDANASYNLSLVLLFQGRYLEAWPYHESRYDSSITRRIVEVPPLPCPRWQGESLASKSLLVVAEQGLGDNIQFAARYAPLLKALGLSRLTLACAPPLKTLMETVQGVDAVVTDLANATAHDYWSFPMSLPLHFGTSVETIPANIPYLFSAAEKRAAWQERLGESTGLRVGLVWSGGFRANQPDTWAVNQRRNIPLNKLAALKLPGISFFSLQKGDDAEAQLRDIESASWGGPDIADYTGEFTDFSDTAAFIDNLDLIISVDTSTAHLAGAMGKEVWLLNRFDTCWRWLLERTDSPWYPSFVLFRQPSPGDWDSVVADVVVALQEFVRQSAVSKS